MPTIRELIMRPAGSKRKLLAPQIPLDSSLITVVIAATEGKYMKWAEKLASSVRKYSPTVAIILYSYADPKDHLARFKCLLEVDTPYVLHIEPDSWATGDIRPLAGMLLDTGKQLLASPSVALDRQRGHYAKYAKMFSVANLPCRKLVGAHFLLDTAFAPAVVSGLYRWAATAKLYTSRFRDTFALALAFAAAGIGDAQTLYVDGTVFSFRGTTDALGLIHHVGGRYGSRAEAAVRKRKKVLAKAEEEEELQSVLPDTFQPNVHWFKTRMNRRGVYYHFAEAIYKVFAPSTLLDVGCGVGWIVEWMLEKGVEAYGVEGSSAAFALMSKPLLPFVSKVDLRCSALPLHNIDLCVSIEVAEHIEIAYVDYFLDWITRSQRLLLTAATSRQPGHNHVNPQPYKYWIDKLKERGWHYNLEETEGWKQAVGALTTGCRWVPKNAMFFEKREGRIN